MYVHNVYIYNTPITNINPENSGCFHHPNGCQTGSVQCGSLASGMGPMGVPVCWKMGPGGCDKNGFLKLTIV